MKKSFSLTVLISCLLLFSVFCTAQELTSALDDIKGNIVTRNTITKLETASRNPGDEVESLYNLARIYHFNPQFSDIKKARTYYSRVQSMYHTGDYSKQVDNLNNKYGVDKRSIDNTINGIDELISNNAFVDAVKTNTFDGRIFEVVGFAPFNKKIKKELLKDIAEASVATRNFPLSANDLRKTLNLKESDKNFVFGTTLMGEKKVVILAKKYKE